MTAKDVIFILFSKAAEEYICFRRNFSLSLLEVWRREKKKSYVAHTLLHTQTSHISITLNNKYIATICLLYFLQPLLHGDTHINPLEPNGRWKIRQADKGRARGTVCGDV